MQSQSCILVKKRNRMRRGKRSDFEIQNVVKRRAIKSGEDCR